MIIDRRFKSVLHGKNVPDPYFETELTYCCYQQNILYHPVHHLLLVLSEVGKGVTVEDI